MDFKGRCINFELWFTNEDEQDMEKIYRTLEHLIKLDIDQAVRDGCNAVIGLLLYEGFLYKNEDDYYDLLRRVYDYGNGLGIKKFVLVCGIVWDYKQELQKRNLEYDLIEFDYSANAMWQSYKDYNICSWHPNTGKYLFLGGVPSRHNRINLLSKFYDSGMLNYENAIWSFFTPTTEEEKTTCRSMLNHYTDDEYNNFIAQVENAVDEKYITAKEYSRASGKEWKQNRYLDTAFFKDPNYINPSVFTNTSISVIAEGHVYPPAWDYRFLTEKTWRAVINRHPFIMADNQMRKNFARSLGLNTFDQFFIEDYNGTDKLDGVVKNVKHFLDICYDKSIEIKSAIDKNFLVFFEVINTNERKLEYLRVKYKLPHTEIDQWFRQKSFDHLFRIPDAIHS